MKSERPVRRTSGDITLAVRSVELRGGGDWGQTCVTGVAGVFEATGLDETEGGARKGLRDGAVGQDSP